MHLGLSIGALILGMALPLPTLHAQTDHPASPTPVTRAIAVYEWTGPLDHPSAARLLPVSLFLHGHLEDAGVYLAQPIPFALQPGNLYLLQHAGQTIGALAIQSAHATLTSTAPAWIAYGRFLTPAEATAATAATKIVILSEAKDPLSATTTTHPKHHRHEKKKPQQAYVTPPPTPLLDDPDRPLLTSGPPPAPATTSELTGLPPDLHQAAAVSDAANRPPETFAYPWPSPTARDQTLQALEALALPHLLHYLAFNHLTPAPAAPTTTREWSSFAAGGGPTSPSPREPSGTPTLLHVQLLAYTLAPAAPPTYLLTAESPLTTAGPVYLTLIAEPSAAGQPSAAGRPSAAGPLHPLLLSLTDATHLDRTPRLLPIDAVDPDATGRADLLFELRSQTTRQFALYALTPTRADQQLLTTPIPWLQK